MIMSEHEFSSMDFEEGEIADNSESDAEASPGEFTEEKKRRHGSSRVPRNTSKSNPSKHSQHGKHRLKHKHEKKSHAKSRLKSSLSIKPNGNVDCVDIQQKEAVNNPRYAQRRSLKSYVSDEDLDFHVSEREKLAKRHGPEDRRRKKKRRNEKPTSRVAKTKCRYFMEGRCHKGDSCPFAHDCLPPKKQELCKFYATGVCSKGPSCLYLHEEFPCKFFHVSGNCNHGDSCKFSHSPLTPSTRALLDRAGHPKDCPSGNDHGVPGNGGGGSGYSNYAEHGDIDYRFGSRPAAPYDNHPLHPCENFERLPGPRNLFTPNFPPDDRLLPPCPNFEMRERMEGRPSLLQSPMCDNLPRPYCPDVRFPVRPSNPFGPGPYPPHRFPTPGNLSDSGFPPSGPPPPVNGQSLLSPLDIHSKPQLPQTTTNGPPHVRDNPDWHPEFVPFRPPFCPPPGSLPFPGPFPSGATVHVNSEAIVSSELDKMAALLAASKPPTPRALSVQTDPRIASSATENRPDEMTARAGDVQIPTQTLLPTGDNTQRRTSLSFSSPELNVVPPKPACITPTTPIPWRLIQLDMSVKIPYPLMQLPIDDLPHRFEDPRLRGQLTALRPHLKPSVQLDDIGDVSGKTIDKSAPDSDSSDQTHRESMEKAEQTPRRPVKLQLNEMASTFSANSFAPVTSNTTTTTTRTGDRSYLDDPRFRRRRIVTCVSTPTAPQPTLTTSVPSESIDHDGGDAEKNESGIES